MRYPAAICSDLRGVNSSLCIGHFYTENIFCEFIAGELKNKFSGLRVEIAVSNRDIVEVI